MAGVVAIARRRALAKQLSTVEILARVDVLCLDKTGTITTGDISLALDAVTTPTCFRNLTIGEGFQWHGPMKVSWESPYKRVLEKGWKRNIWTDVTEEKIHTLWTKPRFQGYAKHLECHFDISDWDEDSRLITIEVSPL